MRLKPSDSKVYWSSNGRRGPRSSVIPASSKPVDPEKAEVFWVDITQKDPTVVDGVRKALYQVWDMIKRVGKQLYRYRRILLSLPVFFVALRLAAQNMAELPQTVYFGAAGVDEAENLVINNFFVSREFAVYGPLVLTGFSILMMFLSKKVVYPWVISIMTLLIPPVILLANSFT